eukprot:scaffold23195_cov23-Tisochrysis_lutea.AAC.1
MAQHEMSAGTTPPPSLFTQQLPNGNIRGHKENEHTHTLAIGCDVAPWSNHLHIPKSHQTARGLILDNAEAASSPSFLPNTPSHTHNTQRSVPLQLPPVLEWHEW